MKKMLFVLLMSICLITSLFANDQSQVSNKFSIIQPEDKWLSFDKWKHFSTSFILTTNSYYQLNNLLIDDRSKCKNISFGISLSFGLAKEIYDVNKKVKPLFSWKDLVYDISGTVLGIVLINKIHSEDL
ncbi:MAG: hypothetical protein U9N76_03985 [Candidatus Marinimicrobia bacterium]|nr:hypothetical protein [Candidatus Neomarinimicrobiota bacterium]